MGDLPRLCTPGSLHRAYVHAPSHTHPQPVLRILPPCFGCREGREVPAGQGMDGRAHPEAKMQPVMLQASKEDKASLSWGGTGGQDAGGLGVSQCLRTLSRAWVRRRATLRDRNTHTLVPSLSSSVALPLAAWWISTKQGCPQGCLQLTKRG